VVQFTVFIRTITPRNGIVVTATGDFESPMHHPVVKELLLQGRFTTVWSGVHGVENGVFGGRGPGRDPMRMLMAPGYYRADHFQLPLVVGGGDRLKVLNVARLDNETITQTIRELDFRSALVCAWCYSHVSQVIRAALGLSSNYVRPV
jgi:hypothetical protein